MAILGCGLGAFLSAAEPSARSNLKRRDRGPALSPDARTGYYRGTASTGPPSSPASLRRSDDAPCDAYRRYEIVDPGYLTMTFGTNLGPPGAGPYGTSLGGRRQPAPAATPGLADVRGKQIVYLTDLTGERSRDPVRGFGGDARDYDIRIESTGRERNQDEGKSPDRTHKSLVHTFRGRAGAVPRCPRSSRAGVQLRSNL